MKSNITLGYISGRVGPVGTNGSELVTRLEEESRIGEDGTPAAQTSQLDLVVPATDSDK